MKQEKQLEQLKQKPVPLPRRNVQQMVKYYEKINSERPIPKPRTIKPIPKPVAAPRAAKPISVEEIKVYPMIKATLDGFRKYELSQSNDKNKAKKSLAELFEKRVKKMQTEVKTVSITINVKLSHTLQRSSSLYSFGPFTVQKPNMSLQDVYRFAFYTLKKSNITFLSGDYVTHIGCKIMELSERKVIKHKMGNLKLESYLLNKQKPIVQYGQNTCVVDYVWNQVRGKRGFKKYSYDKLKNAIYSFVDEGEMISTEELINWVKSCHENVSIHAFDSRHKNFITHSRKANGNVSLVYIVKDHHCWPITDEKLKIIASKANQGGCDDLLRHMSDLTWTMRHENILKLKDLNEISEMNKVKHIIILPEEVKMNVAIDTYCKSSNFYIEYLHWNNNGVLDGFLDHNHNMYLMNNEYDDRKKVCDKLFKIYKSDYFKWSNQSCTSIASGLFKQSNGFIPESSYNVKARQMLDDFYPRALQWCTKDEIPENGVVSIDISKCYPSVLRDNAMEIPVYSTV